MKKIDKLEDLYNIQKNFTDVFFQKKHNININNIIDDKNLLVHWNKEYIISITKEIYEVLDEIDWKMHTSKYSIDIKDNLLEECIDSFKYLMGLMIINGFTVDDIYDKFISKSKVVESKFNQQEVIKNIVKDDRKIAFIDIDGVVADWPNSFIQFVNKNKNYTFDNLKQMTEDLDRNEYYLLKNEYRLSGVKSNMDKVPGILELLQYLRNNNIHIILLTSRPYKKIFRIYSDTLKFLDNNNIIYDAIIWEEEKEKYILENFKSDKVLFCLDDDINNVNLLSNSFKTFLKTNVKLFYNENDMNSEINKKVNDNVIILNNIQEIYGYF